MTEPKKRGARELSPHIRAQIKERIHDLFTALRELETSRTLNNVEIAADLDVVKGSITNWRKSHHREIPSLKNLVDICNKYGVTMDYLVFGHEKPRTIDSSLLMAIHKAAVRRRHTG